LVYTHGMAPDEPGTVTVKLLSFLHLQASERGLPSVHQIEVPAQGCSCHKIAQQLDLPLDMIESALVNGRARSLEHRIVPGDQVAFLPTGTPGPYRLLLGLTKVE